MTQPAGAMISTSDISSRLAHFLTTADGSLLFCSIEFMATFVVFYAIYSLIGKKRRTLMMIYVATFSLFFAYKANGALMLLLPTTVLISWALTNKMKKSEDGKRRAWLILIIILDLLPLLYYKYTNFFIEIVNEAVRSNFSPLSIALPIGISFYTFQAISYSVDVYRKKFCEEVSLLEYLFYITFFPLLLAGPITRADTLIPQLKQEQKIDKGSIYLGLWLIIQGLLKKGLIADYIAQFNNWIFEDPASYSGFENAVGAVGYTLQIYCDFSGYSDISIGIAALLGFKLKENFNFPYRSLNLTEFWHRWHISLSTWFRDYVYIPLGGNRKGKARTYLNNFITMLVAGLWHGASWMFIIWGALHGVGLVAHKFLKTWLDRIPNTLIVRSASWLLTFAYVTVAWVFFRASSLDNACEVLSRIGHDFHWNYFIPFIQARPEFSIFIAVGLGGQLINEKAYNWMADKFIHSPWIIKLLIFIIAVQLVINFSQGNVQPFIYSQF
ncbi:MAG: MBOAT family protein [Muribaculaceae bacterium]|jgi:alginate O-acetyltransferase complex protein AlgI|nr:MBOAT family protein [Muribaculaceae bacterium]